MANSHRYVVSYYWLAVLIVKVTTTLTVPENLVLGPEQVYVWGTLSTTLFGQGFLIGNANVASLGNLEIPVHSVLQKYSEDDLRMSLPLSMNITNNRQYGSGTR